MTDDRLAELFRAAANTAAPPPGFDHGDVVAASRRITARRRLAVTGGALGLLAAVGIGTAVVLPGYGSPDATTTAAAPAAASEGAGSPREVAADAGAAAAAPELARGVPPVTGAPLGPATADCVDRQDPALRALVEQVLPEVVGAPQAAVTTECRPGGGRGVNLEVTDAGAAGLLSVEYSPPGEQSGRTASEASSASAVTASGGTVTVSVRPTEPRASVPFQDRLDATAAFLAPRL